MTPKQLFLLGAFFGSFFLVLGLTLLWKGNVLGWGLVAVGIANYVRIWSRKRRGKA